MPRANCPGHNGVFSDATQQVQCAATPGYLTHWGEHHCGIERTLRVGHAVRGNRVDVIILRFEARRCPSGQTCCYRGGWSPANHSLSDIRSYRTYLSGPVLDGLIASFPDELVAVVLYPLADLLLRGWLWIGEVYVRAAAVAPHLTACVVEPLGQCAELLQPSRFDPVADVRDKTVLFRFRGCRCIKRINYAGTRGGVKRVNDSAHGYLPYLLV